MLVAEILATPVGIPTVRDRPAAVAPLVLIPLVAVQTGAEASSAFLEGRRDVSRVLLEKGHCTRAISLS